MGGIRLPTEAEVESFALQIPVATKDYGLTSLKLWGTQRYLYRTIAQSIAQEDIHEFVVLKARQVGASTFMLLLTLLWMHRFPGIQGLTVTDSQENREYFRDLFLAMVEELSDRDPDAPVIEEVKATDTRTRARNQMQIAWHNGSRVLLQTAGPRTWSRLGVGRGLSFHHGTEMGLWSQGGKSMTYLRSAFSEVNPARLYVFEGTARGKNWFYDLWQSAMRAKTIKAVFLAWWLREDNRLDAQTQKKVYDYYAGPLTAKEREWDRILRKREHVTVTMAQWAWRRWYTEEKAGGNQRLADQEMPCIWEDAFAASQERPFLDELTSAQLAGTVAAPESTWIYKWGSNLEDTHPEPADDKPPMLRVWARPDNRPVIVAAVPARSMSDDDPAWVISVWAAELEVDRIEQVAEFHCELNLGIAHFAWVCLHLAGAYGASHRHMVLNVNGIGMGVLSEIKRLVNTGWGTARTPGFRDVLGSIRHYVYRRPNQLITHGTLQWKSRPDTQGIIFQRFRDQLQRGTANVRSEELAEEVARLEGQGDTYVAAGERPRSHRAGAAALAIESYAQQLYPILQKHRARGPDQSTVGGKAVHEFFATLGRR